MTNSPNYRRATNMAYAALGRLNITTLPVTILPAVAQFRHLRVLSYSELCYRRGLCRDELMDLNVSAHGFISRSPIGPQAIIYYNDVIDPGIVRFTVAHELGHYVLGHMEENAITDKEANCFARNFLCPVPVTDRFALDDISDCCDVFYITPPAAEVALDKRYLDQRNISPPLYETTFQQFGLSSLTKEMQLWRYSARAMRARADFSDVPLPLVI